jgi:hypothetical protein
MDCNINKEARNCKPSKAKKSTKIKSPSPSELVWRAPQVLICFNPRHFDVAADYARRLLASDPRCICATTYFLDAVDIQRCYPTEASAVLKDALQEWGYEPLSRPEAFEPHGFWKAVHMIADRMTRQIVRDQDYEDPCDWLKD